MSNIIYKSDYSLNEYMPLIEEIFDSYPSMYDLEEYKKVLDIPENKLWDIANRLKADDLMAAEDAMWGVQTNDLVFVKTIKTWNGTTRSVGTIPAYRLSDILKYNFAGDNITIFYDGYDVICNDYHHDGVNTYIVREMESKSKYNKYIEGLHDHRFMIDDYPDFTLSLSSKVCKEFGFEAAK